MMVAKYSHSFGEDQRKDKRWKWGREEWRRAADQWGVCRVGSRDGWGHCLAHPAGTYRSEKREVLQCPELLTLATYVATLVSQDCAFFQSLARTEPSATASMKQAWSEMIHISLTCWLLEPVLWVHVAENMNSNFQCFFSDCGLKSGVYKLTKQTQTVVTFQLVWVVKF